MPGDRKKTQNLDWAYQGEGNSQPLPEVYADNLRAIVDSFGQTTTRITDEGVRIQTSIYARPVVDVTPPQDAERIACQNGSSDNG